MGDIYCWEAVHHEPGLWVLFSWMRMHYAISTVNESPSRDEVFWIGIVGLGRSVRKLPTRRSTHLTAWRHGERHKIPMESSVLARIADEVRAHWRTMQGVE